MGLSQRIAAAVESADTVDPAADRLSDLTHRAVPEGALKDALAGRFLGHPLHAALVAGPIGLLLSGTLLDVTGSDNAPAARRLIGAGLLAAAPTAAAGLTDWSDTAGPERRVGFVHATVNVVALGCYGLSWWQRRRCGSGRLAALAGASVLGAGGWLGGHLTYAMGVGVDTTAFQAGPEDWTAVADADTVVDGKPIAVEIQGVSVLFARVDGRLRALANRCSHRGAPLSDGEVADGCVTCPWHGSRFRLTDGQIRRGPAIYPQPAYEVRVTDGTIEVRRAEARTLRANPVGAG